MAMNFTQSQDGVEEEKKKKSSFWDFFVLFLILVVVLSFWGYYHFTKKQTLVGFEKANTLFVEKQYQKSLDVYEDLKGADYLEPIHDSILSKRLDTLYDILNL